MEPPIGRIHISQAAKDQLIKLKRVTKIDQWNILCRWALCRSLAEPSPPSPAPIPADSNLEINWRVLGGEYGDLLLLALKQRCYQEELDPTQTEILAKQLRLHLHRGIGYLAGDIKIKRIDNFAKLAVSPVDP